MMDPTSPASPWLAELLHLPDWVALLIMGIYLAAKIGLAGFVLARTGRSPLWSLAILVPFGEIVGIWALAYCRWPRYEAARAERPFP
jgi:hypothetical protein